MSKVMKVTAAVLVAGLIWLMPVDVLPVEGITVVQQRVVAVFALAMLLWLLEPIPIFATSILVIVLELVCLSDSGLILLRQGEIEAGQLLDHRAVMATFADPIIMLFLGGFFLGAAATKYRLDVNLARVLLRPVGTRPGLVMLGMMAITAMFSMFMSNTATTAMMLAVLMPVLKSIDRDDPARIGFALAIPFAANIGGLGTPIGTPPNAVAIKFLKSAEGDGQLISFAQWMAFAVPFVIVLLLIAWGVLMLMFRPKAPVMNINFRGKWLVSGRAWIVYITSIVTIMLWLVSGKVHGMSAPVVAMIPVGVFCAAGIINSDDLKAMGWDILWLMAGGFALGLALMQTGLSETLIHSIPFDRMSALVIVVAGCLVTFILSNFMSHTATANLMLPLMASLAAGLPQMVPLGGKMMLLLAVTFSASMAMIMPISTPPNAMSYATGWITTRHMIKGGVVIGLVGMLMIAFLMLVLYQVGFFPEAV